MPAHDAGADVGAIVRALEGAGLLASAPVDGPARVTSISDDSRSVRPGALFIAVHGTTLDGHDFIAKARAAGAALVLAEDPARVAGGPAIIVRDGRRAAARAAATFYGNPADALRLIGVTGTNGKTTTVGMLRHLLDDDAGAAASEGRAVEDATGATESSAPTARAASAASIGTLGVLIGSVGDPVDGGAGLTTPGPIELQRLFRLLVDRGATWVAMEVSSHSLAQHRVEGVHFAAVVFTNLTRDHLDYHGTMDAYRDAKLSLAAHLERGGVAVVDADERAWDALPAGIARLTFGTLPTAAVRAEQIAHGPRGTTFRLVAPGGALPVSLPLIGDFNVTNALGAAAAAIALGEPVARVAERLGSMPQVPGRLERIGEHPTVLRDYAHTPDALARALAALRPFVAGRLIVAFGAGGDRDPGKRPLMGAAAARGADVCVVTSDNPRTEDPEKIIDAIVAGMPKGFERVADRRAAIARAIEVADAERDLVLLAGKGHETYQVRGTGKFPFDEAVIVRELLAARR